MPTVNSAEHKLAKALQAAGLPVKRNIYIEHFEIDILVGDFLVVEVDGYSHYTKAAKKRDSYKDEFLTKKGYHVQRITNQSVHDASKLKAFVETIKSEMTSKPGATIPANAPFAMPALMQLKADLEQKERVKTAKAEKEKEAAARVKSEQELFLSWLDNDFQTKQKNSNQKRSSGKKHNF